MSYEAKGKGSLIIKKESFDELVKSVVEKSGGSKPERINELFEDHGFNITLDNDGNIAKAVFPMASTRMATSFLDIIEPFIEEGTELAFEAEDGECWTWPERKGQEEGMEIFEAGLQTFFNVDDFEAIRSDILEWLQTKKYNVSVSEEDDIPTLFTALGFNEPSVDDDQFFMGDEEIDCSQLGFPYIEFLKIVGPYASSGALGYVDIAFEGRKNVTYDDYEGGLQFESAW